MSDNKFRFIDGRMLKLIRVPSLNLSLPTARQSECHETKIDPLKSSEFGAFIKLKADSGEFKGKFRFIDGRMLKLIRVPSLNFGNHPFCRLNPHLHFRMGD